MSFQFEISTRALNEMQDAAIWYEQQSAGLGEKFLISLHQKFNLIQQYPERYPKKVLQFRETFANPFPYSIIYSFHKRRNLILITSIFHNKRNPKSKYKT